MPRVCCELIRSRDICENTDGGAGCGWSDVRASRVLREVLWGRHWDEMARDGRIVRRRGRRMVRGSIVGF